jgi:hypothetical protein
MLNDDDIGLQYKEGTGGKATLASLHTRNNGMVLVVLRTLLFGFPMVVVEIT